MEPDPVCLHNTERPGPHIIPCQFNKTAVSVKGVLGLAHVKGYGMENLLSYVDELVNQIVLEGGVPRTPPLIPTKTHGAYCERISML